MVRALLTLIALASFSLAPAVFAQTSEVALEVARLRVTPKNLEGRATEVAEAVKNAFASQLSNLPKERIAIAHAAIDAETRRQFVVLLVPAAVNAAGAVYERNYNPAELSELAGFYKTETGQLLFGASDEPSPQPTAAANSPTGLAFLQSSLGKKENGGTAWAADNAAAGAIRSAMPTAIAAIRQSVENALSQGVQK